MPVPPKVGRPVLYQIGQRHGSRVIVAEASRDKRGGRMVEVRCDCGVHQVLDPYRLSYHHACRQCRAGGRPTKDDRPARPKVVRPRKPRRPPEPLPQSMEELRALNATTWWLRKA